MPHAPRTRVAGALLALGMLTGCSLVGDDPQPDSAPQDRGQQNAQAIRDTGRPATHDLLATMDEAPTQVFSLPAARTDPRGECGETPCVVTWRPTSAETVVAEGTVGANSRDDRHGFRTAIDVTTGEQVWSTAKTIPPGQVDTGEVCIGATSGALACVRTGTHQYAFRTISTDNGEQVDRAFFEDAPSTEESTIVGMSTELRGDVVDVTVLLQEDEAATRSASVHTAQINADGAIVWHNHSSASIGDPYRSDTYLLGDELVITHVTTQDGEPFALSAQTGDRVRMSSDNADALTGISESAHHHVDDGSAAERRFHLTDSGIDVLPAGDLDEDPAWTIPADRTLQAVCGGAVAVTDEPGDESAQLTLTVRAAEEGEQLWQRRLAGEAAVSCDGEHLVVADGLGLTAFDPSTGEQAWSLEGQWDGARTIRALDPSGPSERFAVISADATGEETLTVFRAAALR